MLFSRTLINDVGVIQGCECWSSDRILQPYVGRTLCVAPVKGVAALQALALYQGASTGVHIQ